MAKRPPVTDVVEEIFQSILATPKRQRRLRSATFWDKFGFERRTKERVEQVREALRRRNLILSLEDANFGVEDKDEWVILSYIEPPALYRHASRTFAGSHPNSSGLLVYNNGTACF